MRISAEGEIYTCLFASEGTSLREPLRAGLDDDRLRQLIKSMGKKGRSSFGRTINNTNDLNNRSKIEMSLIGG